MSDNDKSYTGSRGKKYRSDDQTSLVFRLRLVDLACVTIYNLTCCSKTELGYVYYMKTGALKHLSAGMGTDTHDRTHVYNSLNFTNTLGVLSMHLLFTSIQPRLSVIRFHRLFKHHENT